MRETVQLLVSLGTDAQRARVLRWAIEELQLGPAMAAATQAARADARAAEPLYELGAFEPAPAERSSQRPGGTTRPAVAGLQLRFRR